MESGGWIPSVTGVTACLISETELKPGDDGDCESEEQLWDRNQIPSLPQPDPAFLLIKGTQPIFLGHGRVLQ